MTPFASAFLLGLPIVGSLLAGVLAWLALQRAHRKGFVEVVDRHGRRLGRAGVLALFLVLPWITVLLSALLWMSAWAVSEYHPLVELLAVSFGLSAFLVAAAMG